MTTMRWSAVAALLLGAVAPTHAARSDQASALPAYTPAYEPTTVDERGLWMQADERERMLRDSPLRINDGRLESYLTQVLCRSVGQDRCKGVRIYAMEVPAFNASMMPNGAMEVWSGLLLRVRDEAELASVLGHEFAHFELRHSLAGFKARRSASDVIAWIGVLGAVAASYGYSTGGGNVQISLMGSFFQFNREQETQADLLGLKYISAAGYPAQASSEVWRSLMAESDASVAGRKQKPKQRYSAGFFDTHPTHLARASYLAKEALRIGPSGDARGASYQEAMAPYLPRFLDAQIKLNDFGGTTYLLDNLATRWGSMPELLFARAELYRARGYPRDLQTASDLYRQAAAAGYAAPELHRNLGLALLRNGESVEGRKALEEYLRLKPDASDAKAIASLIEN